MENEKGETEKTIRYIDIRYQINKYDQINKSNHKSQVKGGK